MANIIRAEGDSFCQPITDNRLATEESSLGGAGKLQQPKNIGKRIAFKR
jgi:hypothetical protein